MNPRFANYLLAFSVALFALSFLMPHQPQTTQNGTKTGIYLRAESAEGRVPNLPNMWVVNSTASGVTLNPCQALSLTKDRVRLSEYPKAFCAPITVGSGAETPINFAPIYKLFATPGTFVFSLTTPDASAPDVLTFTANDPGAIRGFFRDVLYRPVYNLFAFLIHIIPGHNLGFAIVALTVLIRLALLLPQHHIMVNGRRLQALQPKIQALQAEHKEDQTKMGSALWELYKAEGVNPLGSCLPLIIQMPILIVLYWVITDISNPVSTYFLYAPLANFRVEEIATIFFGLNLSGSHNLAGVALALLVGGSQWLQVWLSLPPKTEETAEKKEAEPAQASPAMPNMDMMRPFMLWGMPVMIAFTAYAFPAGVGIYWLIGTLFSIAQQLVANRVAKVDIATPKETPEITIIANLNSKKKARH